MNSTKKRQIELYTRIDGQIAEPALLPLGLPLSTFRIRSLGNLRHAVWLQRESKPLQIFNVRVESVNGFAFAREHMIIIANKKIQNIAQ